MAAICRSRIERNPEDRPLDRVHLRVGCPPCVAEPLLTLAPRPGFEEPIQKPLHRRRFAVLHPAFHLPCRAKHAMPAGLEPSRSPVDREGSRQHDDKPEMAPESRLAVKPLRERNAAAVDAG